MCPDGDGAVEGCGDFEAALAELLAVEGGYVDDPDDSGGPTKYGITLGSWRDYTGRAEACADDVAAITLDDAHAFYREMFWDPMRLGALSVERPLAARAIFNLAVLHGPGRVVRVAQRLVGVREDGVIGPATRRAIAAEAEPAFLRAFGCAMTERLCGIVAADPPKVKFLRGWVRRSLGVVLAVPP